jgi:hypothetical protein
MHRVVVPALTVLLILSLSGPGFAQPGYPPSPDDDPFIEQQLFTGVEDEPPSSEPPPLADALQIDTRTLIRPVRDVDVLVEDDPVLVYSEGWMPHSLVDMWWYSTPVFLGKARADANGVVRARFPVPLGTPRGAHHVVLNGADPEGRAQRAAQLLQVAVRGRAAPSSGASGPVEMLPATGLQITNGVALILLLLLGGAGMLRLSGRRRAQERTQVG